jgi:HK97 family phage prohead protease
MKFELRFQKAELRATEDGQVMHVSGYVNKTGQLSNVLGTTTKFVEKIAPGAFARALQNATRDIDFLAEHNDKLILASTRNNSLTLREDNVGLYMEATIAPTSWGRDYYQLIQDGILRNMSFGFVTLKDSWDLRDDGIYERTIEDLELIEVSVVRDPAYSQSTIAARGIDVIEEVKIPDELDKEKRNVDELKELLKSIEERVLNLSIQFEEFRKAQKQDDQKDQQNSEQNSNQDPQSDGKTSDQEKNESQNKQSQGQKENKDAELVTDTEEPDEEDEDDELGEEDEEDDDTEENSQDSSGSEDKKKRSLVIAKELSELRNILTSLK